MRIIEKLLSELWEYENNPRFNDEAVEYVANSIHDFGFRVPIVIDSHGVIVAGHTRVKAAKQLGLKKVPCIVADDLTDEQIIAYRLADNKTAEQAGWDFAALDKELAEIVGLDMTAYGFGKAEDFNIEDLFAGNDKAPSEKPPRRVRCPHCGSVVEP